MKTRACGMSGDVSVARGVLEVANSAGVGSGAVFSIQYQF